MSFYRDLKNDCMFCKRLAKYNELVILVCKLTEWFWLWYCYQWTVNTRKNGIQLPSNLIQGWYFGSSMFRAIFRNLKQIVLVHCSGSGAGCRTLRVGKRTFPENGLCCQEKIPYEVKFLPVIITSSTTQYFVIVLPWIY